MKKVWAAVARRVAMAASSARIGARKVGEWLAKEFDRNDLLFAAGLAALVHGLNQVYAPAAFVVAGIILLWVATYPMRYPSNPKPPPKGDDR